MSRRVTWTPSSRIRNALRQLSLRSRERQDAMKLAKRTCRKCGKKASVAKGRVVKVEAHHKRQPNWERIIAVIHEEILQMPTDYEVLCVECHEHETEKQRDDTTPDSQAAQTAAKA